MIRPLRCWTAPKGAIGLMFRLNNYACVHQKACKGNTFLRDKQEKYQKNRIFLFVQVI